jgi:toxin ParE1/3/4
LKVTFNAEAEREFSKAAIWYADKAGAEQARDFRNEVHRTLRLLVEHPAIGGQGGQDTRSLVVHRYPYSVVYRVQVNTLRILAVACHSRRPGYWGGRR